MTTATILTSKIRESKSENGLVTFITDANKSRRQTAEVLEVMKNGKVAYNVRIDRFGNPHKYIAAVPTVTPLAAYEYACEFASVIN